MKRTLTVLLVAGSLAALPAVAQRSGTKFISKTNPAGSHTMVMTKSDQGATRTMSRTMTNTEGNKVLTSSRTMTHTKGSRAHLTKTLSISRGRSKSNAQVARLHRTAKIRRMK
jgi:hypothetical protein